MCWFGNLKESKGKVASEDIFVYKVLNIFYSPITKNVSGFFSPYKNMPYKIGEIYTVNPYLIEPKNVATPTDIAHRYGLHYTPTDITHRIDYGLHCYNEECMVGKTAFDSLYIDQPNGNFITGYASSHFCSPVLTKCKIPKGTKYYENSRGEIVTEKLETLYVVDVASYKHCKDLKKLEN